MDLRVRIPAIDEIEKSSEFSETNRDGGSEGLTRWRKIQDEKKKNALKDKFVI